ncbi:hypothetical protein GGU10DRAFT_427751, partial [Lentinula aff. detonsa]
MGKSEKKVSKVDKATTKAATKDTAKKAENPPKTSKTKTLKQTPVSSKDILAKAKKAQDASKKAKSDSEEEEKTKPKVNGKAKAPPSSDESSEESSDEDEKPKAAQVKKAIAAAKKSASSEEESSDSDSDSEDEVKKPSATSKTAKTTPSSNKQKDESSSDSDSSSSEDEAPKKDATSEGTSDDSSSSEDEVEKKKLSTAASTVKTKDSSDNSSDDDSSKNDDSSDSEDSDAEMEDGTKTNGKRKATEDAPAPPKKMKLANGEAMPAEEETQSIFVGKLSWNVDNDWLAQEFGACGTVVSATVQMDRNTGRSRGFGYVHFSSSDAVAKALEMDGKEIDGRPIKVDKSTPPNKDNVREKRAKTFGDQTSPPSQTLFVGNLSFSANEDSVWEFFNDYGVKNVRLPTDRDTGRPKGFGYVEFDDIDGAKKAFEAMNGQDLDGRTVRLDFSQPRDSAGGGGGRGGRGGFG